MSTTLAAGVAYDAVSLLGFGAASSEPLPMPEPGTIILRYGGWSLRELRDKCSDLIWNQDWYNRHAWSGEKLPSGLYVLRLPIPDSNDKTYDAQHALLLPGEEDGSVVLSASALLLLQLSGGRDPLRGGWTRCKERADGGLRIELDWNNGRLGVSNSDWDDSRDGRVWLSSARRLPEPCPSSP